MNRTASSSTSPSLWERTSLDSKAFGVLLSAMFALTLAVAAAGWLESGAGAILAAGPAHPHVFA